HRAAAASWGTRCHRTGKTGSPVLTIARTSTPIPEQRSAMPVSATSASSRGRRRLDYRAATGEPIR
ncbi:hypothetical protein M3622_21755, partial [Bacillus subtilis]|nr:hypothetical protein [Bacillus subtilis]